MRKNYFAKKFVAYSMAFAVAFSTLTVSPVFVREAKAATETLITVDFSDVTTDNNNVLDDGDIILSEVTSTESDGIATNEDAKKSKKIIADAKIVGNVMTGITLKKNSDESKEIVIEEGKTLGALSSEEPVITTGLGASSKYNFNQDVIFNDKVRGTDTTKGEDKNGNINFSLTVPTSGDKDVHMYQGKYSLFKLVPSTKTYVNEYTLSETQTKKTETVTVKYYTVTNVDAKYRKSGEMNTFECAKLTNDDMGLYLAAEYNNDKLDDSAAYALFEMKEKSEIAGKTEDDVNENQEIVYATVGSNAKLEASILTTSKTRNLTWTWTRYGKTIASEDGVVNLTNIKEEDFGNYYYTITDGLSTDPVEGIIELKKAERSIVDGTIPSDNTKIASIAKVLTDENMLYKETATLNTTIPENKDFKYIWVYNTNEVVPVSYNDKLGHNASNRSVTLTTNAKLTNDITCYAVDKDLYEEKLETVLNNVKNATEASLPKMIDALITAEVGAVQAGGDLADAVKYTETIKLVAIDSEDTSEVVYLQPGKELNLVAPIGVSYIWSRGTSATNVMKLNIASAKDIGKYECTRTYKDAEDHDQKSKHTFNVIYVSDLVATANDVSAKLGTKNVDVVVNATSTLPVSYTWSKTGLGSTVVTNKDNKLTIEEVKEFTENSDYNATTGEPTDNYIQCVVDDGFNPITLKIAVKELASFNVEEYTTIPAEATAEPSELKPAASATPVPVTVYAEKDTTVKLEPKVTINDGTEVTYRWTSGGKTVGTDKTFTIDKFANGVDYYFTATSAEKLSVIIKYTTSVVDRDSLNYDGTVDLEVEEAMVYTGEELNPVTRVVYTENTKVIELVEGTDYEVVLTSATNSGVGRYVVNGLGKFKTITEADGTTLRYPEGKLASGDFYIDRADNEVTVADKTVVHGESVQPKTTNKAGAAVTYTYYADADCTTALEAAPTTVGTFYVKANAIATTNYNQAESNVAKVTVVPGKPKIGNTSRTASSITLNWAKTTGATAYRVYIKKDGKYTKVANTTGLKYTVTGLASATTYQFAVKAFANGVASTVYSSRTTTTAPAKVSTLAVKAKGSRKVAISYSKVTRATGYQVYMAKGNGSYKKVAQGKLTAITKSKLTKRATYKFKVRAYKTVGSNVYYGAFSSAKAVKVK